MTPSEVDEFVRRAEAIYAARLKEALEPDHLNEFVVIEPESGDYFLGKTLGEATQAARQSHPGRLTHALRVGHRAAIYISTTDQVKSRSIRGVTGDRSISQLARDEAWTILPRTNGPQPQH